MWPISGPWHQFSGSCPTCKENEEKKEWKEGGREEGREINKSHSNGKGKRSKAISVYKEHNPIILEIPKNPQGSY